MGPVELGFQLHTSIYGFSEAGRLLLRQCFRTSNSRSRYSASLATLTKGGIAGSLFQYLRVVGQQKWGFTFPHQEWWIAFLPNHEELWRTCLRERLYVQHWRIREIYARPYSYRIRLKASVKGRFWCRSCSNDDELGIVSLVSSMPPIGPSFKRRCSVLVCCVLLENIIFKWEEENDSNDVHIIARVDTGWRPVLKDSRIHRVYALM